jgi:hypothetical protein
MNKKMKKCAYALLALGLLTAGLLTRSWAISWPQAGFREWQTAFNPVETLLLPIPDLFWWSSDVDVNNAAAARGRVWSTVEIDYGYQGLPDPVLVVGRQKQLSFYRPNLPRGLVAGATDPIGTVTFPGTGAPAAETGILTTNPVVAISPAVFSSSPGASGTSNSPLTPPRLVFVTYGLGLQSPGLTADDPAYVQAVQVTSSGTTFQASPLGRLKIQQPVSGGTPRETRITGMTFADIGDANTPLPFLFLTTADGEVICVDTTPFQNSKTNADIDPAKAIRWRWVNPGPMVVVPTGGGTPMFPANHAAFAPIPFNDGMNPAVGQVSLNGLPDLPSLAPGNRRANEAWQTQVQALNKDWMVFVADKGGNAWAIEAFGEAKSSTNSRGQVNVTLTGKGRTRWRATIPGGGSFPPRFAVPPVFWNGNNPQTTALGDLTGQNQGWKDLVVFAGVNNVVAYDAQGNFLMADKPVYWDESQFAPGAAPSIPVGSMLTPVTRKLGEADGTTQLRWRIPEAGANAPVDGRFAVTAVRAMAGWVGPQQANNTLVNFANTEDDDDRIFVRWNETYVRNIDRTTTAVTEPTIADEYVERLGSISAYGSVETRLPIDTNKPVTVTFAKTVNGAATTYTIPPLYVSILPKWTDTSSIDANNRVDRGRITITKPIGLDRNDQPVALNPGDLLTVSYDAQVGGTHTEKDVPYPSRIGRAAEHPPGSLPKPKLGDLVPTSFCVNAVTIQEEGTASPTLDEFITLSQTADDYNPDPTNVTRYAVNPGMSIANDNLYFGSRYRGRVYVIEAESLLPSGQLINGNLEKPVNGPEPGPNDSIQAAITPVGNPPIADGWMYVSYANGFLGAYSNQGGGGLGTNVEPPVGPFNPEGNRRSSIPEPQIRVTDANGNPITNENQLQFDWGQPVKLSVTFQIPANVSDNSVNLWTNPLRVTLRGPMGDLPPVTVSPARKNQQGEVAGTATPEVIIPNAMPANPMTPGTPLLSETPVAKRSGTAHWEIRVEQIGTNWLRPDDTVGPWEPDREAATWDPSKNTAPWFTLNNPIALDYFPPNRPDVPIAMIQRFANAPTNLLYQGKNGDPYDPSRAAPISGSPDVKIPTVLTVGVDPATFHQLLFAEHGKSSPAFTLAIVDRSDLGLRPNLGSLKVRVQLPKVTKLGFPLINPGTQPTAIPYGSIDQNYPDDGPDGFYPSIPGDRLNVVKQADASNAASGSVALRGAVSDPNNPTGPPVLGSDGFEQKHLQPELFNVSVSVPQYQPDGIYATRARLTDPATAGPNSPPVPSPGTAVNPTAPYRDYMPNDTSADLNNPPFQVGLNDRPMRVIVFVDANNNGKLDLQGNYREAYRTFAVQVGVEPDMRLQTLAVAPRTGEFSRLLDLGKIWQGFATPTWSQLGTLNDQGRTFFEQYWKPFVIQNTGNVNLIRIKPEVMLSLDGQPFGPVRLPSDSVDLYDSMSLMRDPTRGGNRSVPGHIYLQTSLDNSLWQNGEYDKGGVWLQKARPGASSPGNGLYSADPNPAAGKNAQPYEPKLTLNIPMGTPLGTYAGDVRFFNDRQVVKVNDNTSQGIGYHYEMRAGDNNGLLDRTRDPQTGQIVALEPYSDPTMSVKVRVTEDVAAGSTADPNVRAQLGVTSGALARTSPAAGLDVTGQKMLLFYSSNQEGLKASQPLRFDVFGETMPFDSALGTFPYDPTPLSGGVWTTPTPISTQTVTGSVLVKNTTPSFVQAPGNKGLGYVFWQENQTDSSGNNQARILYRQVSPSLGSNVQILAPGGVTSEAGAVRQAPRAAVVPAGNNGGNLQWFVFWNGSEQQKGNLIFSQSADPTNPASWTAETAVPTSPSLATVSNASPAYVPSTGTLWVFYNGFSQRLGRSDVYATKLDPTTLGTRQTAVTANAPASRSATYGLLGFGPRLGDILRANATRTMYTATGVDWHVDQNNPLAIFINGYVPIAGRSGPGPGTDGLEFYLNGKQITTTDRGLAANGEHNWSFDANLKNGTNTTVYLAVDESAGTIRFSLAPNQLALTGWNDPNRPKDPEVVADYVPGSLRLTNSDTGASGGVGFTTSTYEPSWYWNTDPATKSKLSASAPPYGARADRIWSVWRRSGSATNLGPTLYYKAFRPGLQLISPLLAATARGNFYTFSIQLVPQPGAPPSLSTSVPVLQDADLQRGILWFKQEDEGKKVAVTVSSGSTSVTEIHFIGWREESNEAPVPMDVSVNEGTVSAFPLLDARQFTAVPGDTIPAAAPHLQDIWLFWTSTRGAGSDIFHATIAPRLTPLPG